jgi:GT2 family glycosyltransferase
MEVTAYIPCFNGAAWLREAIDSLLGQTEAVDELLVIDDGSTDHSAAIAAGYGAPVRLVRHDRNRGLAAARNTALREARHHLVASIDADARAAPDWLAGLLDGLATPWTAAAGGRLVEACQERVADRWRAAHMAQHAGPFPLTNPPVLPGANTLVRRDLVLAVGGYDESLRRNYEDTDLQHRLIAAGYRTRYEPGALAYHLRRDTAQSVLRTCWHWLHPPFERRGAYETEQGLMAKFDANAAVARRALWVDFADGAPARAYLSLCVLLLFPAADLAHAAQRAAERGDPATQAGLARAASGWPEMLPHSLDGRSARLSACIAGDVRRLAWWASGADGSGAPPAAGRRRTGPFNGGAVETLLDRAVAAVERHVRALPRAWWPAIEDAREALAAEEGWGR